MFESQGLHLVDSPATFRECWDSLHWEGNIARLEILLVDPECAKIKTSRKGLHVPSATLERQSSRMTGNSHALHPGEDGTIKSSINKEREPFQRRTVSSPGPKLLRASQRARLLAGGVGSSLESHGRGTARSPRGARVWWDLERRHREVDDVLHKLRQEAEEASDARQALSSDGKADQRGAADLDMDAVEKQVEYWLW